MFCVHLFVDGSIPRTTVIRDESSFLVEPRLTIST